MTALVSGLGWFAFSLAGMAGGMEALADADAWLATVRDMDFGQIWAVRMALAVTLVFLPAVVGRRGPSTAAVWISALLLASLALVGHARREPGALGLAHVGLDALHLLAAGFWVGALIPLAAALGRAGQVGSPLTEVETAVARFSRLAVWAVAALLLTGVTNAVLLLSTPLDLLNTPYGRVLTLKLLLVGGMLALAAVNKRRLTPALAREDGARAAAGRLRRHVLAEQVLAAGVLASVALLGVLAPPSA